MYSFQLPTSSATWSWDAAHLDNPGRHPGVRGRSARAGAERSGPPTSAPDAGLFSAKVPGTAWRSKPSWYIVADNDRTVQPDLERFVAERMDAHTYHVDSSHVPMLSQPGFVLDVIRKAASSL